MLVQFRIRVSGAVVVDLAACYTANMGVQTDCVEAQNHMLLGTTNLRSRVRISQSQPEQRYPHHRGNNAILPHEGQLTFSNV